MGARLSGPPSWVVALVVAPFVGVPVALFTVRLVGRAWADCDVGINASANSYALFLLVLPVTGLVNTGVFGGTFWGTYLGFAQLAKVKRWPGTLAAYAAAFVLALVPLVFSVWAVMDFAIPENYPDPVCPDNVPSWWPSWLPV